MTDEELERLRREGDQPEPLFDPARPERPCGFAGCPNMIKWRVREKPSEYALRRFCGRSCSAKSKARTDRASCDVATLDNCGQCGRPMHRNRGRACQEGHLRHGARGNCEGCHSKIRRATGAVVVDTAAVVVEPPPEDAHMIRAEWRHFHGVFGYTAEQLAEKLGITEETVRRVVAEKDEVAA